MVLKTLMRWEWGDESIEREREKKEKDREEEEKRERAWERENEKERMRERNRKWSGEKEEERGSEWVKEWKKWLNRGHFSLLFFTSLIWRKKIEKKLVKICVEDTNEITCERTTIGKGRVDSPISCPALSSEIFQINDKFMIAAFMENI